MATKKDAVTDKPKYSWAQIVEAARGRFNTLECIVVAALSCDGRDEYTIEEAEEVIAKFTNKEVR